MKSKLILFLILFIATIFSNLIGNFIFEKYIKNKVEEKSK